MFESINLNIIGAGRVGLAFARALREKNLEIAIIIDSDAEKVAKAKSLRLARKYGLDLSDNEISGCIFICVPDDRIAEVGEKLAETQKSLKYAYHFSGSLGAEILGALKSWGTKIGSMHPIQTFSGDDSDFEKMQQIYWALEGEADAINFALQIIQMLQGTPINFSADEKKVHHLACTFAANYLNFLIAVVIRLYENIGINEQTALRLIAPLVNTSLSNILKSGVEKSITGPAARGDIGTISQHLDILEKNFPDMELIYKVLGRQILNYNSVLEKLEPEKIQALREKLEFGKNEIL